MLPIGVILHPTDFSERSQHAFHLACSLARDHGASLILLHVVLPPSAVALRESTLGAESLDYREPLWEELQKLERQVPAVRVDCRLEEGYAAPEILRVARDANCDLIVLGTHGRTGLGRALLGSVAEQIVRKAQCPVLTVKVPLSVRESSAEARPEEAGTPF